MTRQQSSLAIAALLAAPFLLACPGFGDETVGGIPTNPTYDVDVKPILDEKCVPCHTVPPQAGAPNCLRFDQYADDGTNQGVFTNRFNIQNRVVDQNNMPPASRPELATSPTERAIIDLWVDQGGLE